VRIAGALAIILIFGSGLWAQTDGQSVQGQSNSVQAAAPAQPIPYRHKTHIALGLKCDFCHTNADPGVLMGFPSTTKCMQCHVSIAKDSPAIQKLAQYDKAKQEVPWVRVYAVPAWVYWNHRQHLEAKVQCESCHGPVAEMDVMKLATNVTTMQGCVDCHTQRDAPVGCNRCHEDMTQ